MEVEHPNFTYTPGGEHHSGDGPTVHEVINFNLVNGEKQDTLAVDYSHFLQSLIASGFGSDVNGDGVISYDIGQSHHNPTIEGTTIDVTSWQNLTVKTGATTQGREVATAFHIHNNDVCTTTPATVTSNDGHDVISGSFSGRIL